MNTKQFINFDKPVTIQMLNNVTDEVKAFTDVEFIVFRLNRNEVAIHFYYENMNNRKPSEVFKLTEWDINIVN